MFSKVSRVIRPKSLATRLTLGYSATFISLLMVVMAALYFTLHSHLLAELDADFIEDVEEFQQSYAQDGLAQLNALLATEITADEHQYSFIRLIDSNNKVLFSSDLSHWNGLDSSQLSPTTLTKTPYLETQKLAQQEFETRIVYAKIADHIYLQMGESTEKTDDILQLLLYSFIAIFALVVPIAMLIVYKLAQRSADSISAIEQVVRSVTLGQLEQRVNITSQDEEIQKLAASFNIMADRIKHLLKEMREMTDNIAHDLKSPLGRIRGLSEMALSELVADPSKLRAITKTLAQDILEECDRLLKLINDSLDVAEAEAGIKHKPDSRINFSALVQDACELFEVNAEQKNILLKYDITPNSYIWGNLPSLQRTIANLLDNAIKYTPNDGVINLELKCDNNNIKMIVTNTGIGIPQSEQVRVFERFFRCDQSRSQAGCGLGLSYSKAVINAHGGNIHVESTPKKHTSFIIALPAIAM